MSGTIDFGGQKLTVAAGATLQFFISSQALYTKLTNIDDLVLEGEVVVRVREGASGLAVGKEFQLWKAEAAGVNIEKLTLGALPEGLYWDITDLSSDGILRVTDDPELSVRDITIGTPAVVRTEYYDLNGRRVTAPTHGLFIVRRYLSDGTVQVKKIEN